MSKLIICKVFKVYCEIILQIKQEGNAWHLQRVIDWIHSQSWIHWFIASVMYSLTEGHGFIARHWFMDSLPVMYSLTNSHAFIATEWWIYCQSNGFIASHWFMDSLAELWFHWQWESLIHCHSCIYLQSHIHRFTDIKSWINWQSHGCIAR